MPLIVHDFRKECDHFSFFLGYHSLVSHQSIVVEERLQIRPQIRMYIYKFALYEVLLITNKSPRLPYNKHLLAITVFRIYAIVTEYFCHICISSVISIMQFAFSVGTIAKLSQAYAPAPAGWLSQPDPHFIQPPGRPEQQ